MNRKFWIIIVILILIAVGSYALVAFYPDKLSFKKPIDKFKDYQIISGEVIKVDQSAIYFKVRAVRSKPAESPELGEAVVEEKAALISPDTEFVTLPYGRGGFVAISRDEIVIGSKIAVHFDKHYDYKAFEAKRIQLNRAY